MKKITALVLLGVFLSSCLFSYAVSSVATLRELMEELQTIQASKDELIKRLLENNTTQSENYKSLEKELLDALALLNRAEESVKKQIALSENLENLIDDQAIYIRKLKRNSMFWKITSGILAASTAALIIWGVNK